MKQAAFKYVEDELFNYPESKKEIERIRDDIIHGKSTTDENIGGGRAGISKPTERIATMLLTNRKLEHLERVVNAIDYVVNNLPEERRQLVVMRYWTKPQTYTWDGLAYQLDRDRATLIRWRNDIVVTVGELIGL